MWRGRLVALAGGERFYIVAPELQGPTACPRDFAYVTLLCLYHRQVIDGVLPDETGPAVAERWADALLDELSG